MFSNLPVKTKPADIHLSTQHYAVLVEAAQFFQKFRNYCQSTEMGV